MLPVRGTAPRSPATRAYIRGRRITLLSGPESDANFREAQKKLKQIVKGSKNDQTPGTHRVADIIDRYLNLHKSSYSERAYAERYRYLQAFAEDHGWRKVNDRDCLPVHIEEWVAAHPEWKSEWTRAQAITIVMRPFNWAAKKRIIPANPFRGVEKVTGEARRPMTDAEFQLILKNSVVRTKPKRTGDRYPSGRKICPSDRRKRQESVQPPASAKCSFACVTPGCGPASCETSNGATWTWKLRSWFFAGTKPARKLASPAAFRCTPWCSSC